MGSVTVDFQVTTRDLMDVKNCYDLYTTEAAVRFMFEKQNAGLRFIKIVSADPDPINHHTILIKVQAERVE
jgi:hypothetical protein